MRITTDKKFNSKPEKKLKKYKPLEMKKKILAILTFTFVFRSIGQTVTDIDSNVYNTVTVGAQTWMKENLKVTRFKDGKEIPLVTKDDHWINLTSPAMCIYNNADSNLIYGRLYNWYAVESNSLCPEGWRVPSNADWDELVAYLGGMYAADDKIKETGIAHWVAPNKDANNSSGFTALPGGYRDPMKGTYVHLGADGNWWSSSQFEVRAGYFWMAIEFTFAATEKNGRYQYGNSVRCLEGISSGVETAKPAETLIVYPNPAQNILYVNNYMLNNARIEIINFQGKVVLSKNSNANTIDISGISKGVYVLKLTGSKIIQIAKFLKE